MEPSNNLFKYSRLGRLKKIIRIINYFLWGKYKKKLVPDGTFLALNAGLVDVESVDS